MQGAFPAKSSNQEMNTHYGCKRRAVCQAYFLLHDSKLCWWKICTLISISSHYTVNKADHQNVIMANDSNHWCTGVAATHLSIFVWVCFSATHQGLTNTTHRTVYVVIVLFCGILNAIYDECLIDKMSLLLDVCLFKWFMLKGRIVFGWIMLK